MSGRVAKYQVRRSDGTPIPDDEPCFVIRGKDVFAVAVMNFYYSLAHGTADPQLMHDLDQHLFALREWRRRHREQIKIPD
jgi:hypothetical protein